MTHAAQGGRDEHDTTCTADEHDTSCTAADTSHMAIGSALHHTMPFFPLARTVWALLLLLSNVMHSAHAITPSSLGEFVKLRGKGNTTVTMPSVGAGSMGGCSPDGPFPGGVPCKQYNATLMCVEHTNPRNPRNPRRPILGVVATAWGGCCGVRLLCVTVGDGSTEHNQQPGRPRACRSALPLNSPPAMAACSYSKYDLNHPGVVLGRRYLKNGGRSLHDALSYCNQYGTGQAVKDSKVPRSQVFMMSMVRVPASCFTPPRATPCCRGLRSTATCAHRDV